MASTATRVGAAVATGGTSELARKKPFQPGGGGGNLVDAALGPYGAAVLEGGKALGDAMKPKIPQTPGTVQPASTDSAAVQQVASETSQRRSRARGYRSTLLSQNFLSSDNPALKQTYGS